MIVEYKIIKINPVPLFITKEHIIQKKLKEVTLEKLQKVASLNMLI